ncbi:flagellar hook-basal body complex protein [Eubacteriaceae bacterium ES3]|nr:flagellar hook-basal body complex protein [Eubacteriaceae bacterium ES3]
MLRSLYSAVSGMNAHQTKLNVIGNNIANVNTYGFKASRVVFSDVLYQNVRNSVAGSADAADSATGGVNPSQMGYGVKIGSIDLIMTNASGADTGRAMDCFIDGDGFFMVNTGLDDAGMKILKYTRVGNFSFDSAGNLVDSNGSIVQGTVADTLGWTLGDSVTGAERIVDGQSVADITDPTNDDYGSDTIGNITLSTDLLNNLTGVSIDYTGAITGIINSEPVVLGYIALSNFGNPDALGQDGNGYYTSSNNSGDAQPTEAQKLGTGRIVSGGLEMSNVDLSKEFTEMITAQRGFQANTRIVSVSDGVLEELVNLKR